MVKYISANEAAMIVKDRDTVCIGAMGLSGWPDELGIALQKRFNQTGHPNQLTLRQGSKTGDSKERGVNRFAQEGMVKTWIAAHIGGAEKMTQLVLDNKLSLFCLPQGIVVNMWREIAARRPGIISKVGLGTFVDPRVEGGCMNNAAKEADLDIVKLISFNGEEYLHYKSFKVDVALIRGTVADEDGNITMDREGQISEALSLAEATHNTGGIVIAQVEYVVKNGTIMPKDVKVPSVLVDYVVQATNTESCWQTENTYYNPAYSGEIRIPLSHIKPMELDYKKIIARRCSVELKGNKVINLGVGLPANIATIMVEEGIGDNIFFTTEGGVIGGIPAACPEFGNHYNPDAMIDHGSMFDLYDGGGLDIAFLGLAEVDSCGNVNVSKFGKNILGPGGFINICQNTNTLVFCGAFTVGAEISIQEGALKIIKDGKHRKFVNNLQQITFNSQYANGDNKTVMYITERAVFKLIQGQITLIEIAPGVDLWEDVVNKMEFKPLISKDLKMMDEKLFKSISDNLKKMVV